MPKRMKVPEVIRLIEDHGWILARTRGSHRQYHHPLKPGTVTVPGKLSAVMQPGLLNSILRQAQIRMEE